MNNPSGVLVADWRTSESTWDWAVLVLLTGLLLFMPLSLGAVEAWSELVVVLVAAGLSLCLILRSLLDRQFHVIKSWVYLTLAVILGLIVFQLVPLPAGLVSTIAPHTMEVRAQFLGESGSAPAGGFAKLSLYPYQTAHDLRMALIFVTLFVTVSCSFKTSQQIIRFLKVLFAVGCIEAGLSLLQILTMSHKIHWLYAERATVVTSGSFINYSHFCQFINLALGAGLALLLVRLKEDKREDQFHTVGLGGIRWERYLRLLGGLVLCALAVLMSMSRNGAISLFVATAVIGGLLYYRGELSTRGWLLGMAPWCVLIVLFFTSFDLVYDRLATLEDGSSLEGRLEMTSGTLSAWRDFPLWGSGLGTYEFVFPLYDPAVSPVVAEHADNDWAQLLEEFGLVGAAAVVAFLASVLIIARKLLFRGRTILSVAVFGLCLGLIATAIHSLSDFGQHLPAVFAMTAAVSGLILAIANYESSKRRDHKRRSSSGKHSPLLNVAWGIALGIGWVAVWGWALSGAYAAYRAEAWTNIFLAMQSRIQQAEDPVSDQDYVDLLNAAEQAALAEPDNALLAYQLNLVRWRSISRTRDPETGQLLLHPDALPIVEQIADELARSRRLCPTFGPPYALEGELRLFVLQQPAGEQLIRQAAELAPYDALTCLTAGQMAAQQGDTEEARSWLDRAVALDPNQFSHVASLYLEVLKRPELAEALAGEDHRKISQLIALLNVEDADPEYAQLAETLRSRRQAKLRALADSGAASASEYIQMATLENQQENYAAAIPYFNRALALDYGQVGWRLALAQTLAKVGQHEAAIREAKICLRLRPGYPAATRLIEEVSVLPIKSPSPGPE
ncbi:O-antigen ligase family protein [Bythopirellula polymerisocia]|uniref:O-Antigen ligase n=1 Tax=Bythopirellula polymerisocia TaxID=2528003 RepID=A0A5C6CLL3_9BACT|nr:O-antigen ligase family protein [Bythopirellula polymerisocia]TWU25783.1 O-Antigen ligase [Bythopirellula polymerisocia]